MTYTIASEAFAATTGDIIFIPRTTPHSFTDGTLPARLLATFTPGGNDQFFMEHGILVDDSNRLSPPS